MRVSEYQGSLYFLRTCMTKRYLSEIDFGIFKGDPVFVKFQDGNSLRGNASCFLVRFEIAGFSSERFRVKGLGFRVYTKV